MKPLLTLFWLAIAVCVMACGATVQPPVASFADVPPSTCDELDTVRLTFHGDPAFTTDERRAIAQAMVDWRDFSAGHVVFDVVFDDSQSEPRILRLAEDDPSIAPYEAKQPVQPFYVLGWTDGGNSIRLIPSRVPPEQLHTLVAHELGHAAGLAWPLGCYIEHKRTDCIHSPDPQAVMAAQFSGAPAFTPSDLAFCRISCLCP